MAPRFPFHDVMDTLFPEGRARGMQIFTEDEMAQINGLPDKAKARARRKRHAQAVKQIQTVTPAQPVAITPLMEPQPEVEKVVPVALAVSSPEFRPSHLTPETSTGPRRVASVATTDDEQLLDAELTSVREAEPRAPFKRLWQTLQQHSFPASKPQQGKTEPSTEQDSSTVRQQAHQPMVWSLPVNIQRLEAQLVNAPEYGPQPLFETSTLSASKPAVIQEDDLFAIQESARQEIAKVQEQQSLQPVSMPRAMEYQDTSLVSARAVDSLLASARLEGIVQDQTHRLLERNRFLSQSINNLAENYFQMQRNCS